jgi:hypothetical protein
MCLDNPRMRWVIKGFRVQRRPRRPSTSSLRSSSSSMSASEIHPLTFLETGRVIRRCLSASGRSPPLMLLYRANVLSQKTIKCQNHGLTATAFTTFSKVSTKRARVDSALDSGVFATPKIGRLVRSSRTCAPICADRPLNALVWCILVTVR